MNNLTESPVEQPARVRSEAKFLAELWGEREYSGVGFIKTHCDSASSSLSFAVLQVVETATFKSPPGPGRVAV